MLFIVLFIVLIFYLLIPASGAFFVRNQWKNFRKNITASGSYPVLDYHKFREKEDNGYSGLFRFFGKIEAIKDENEIWLRRGNFTVTADLEKTRIYIIRDGSSNVDAKEFFEKPGKTIADEMPQIISWNRVFSLPENSEMMIFGPFFKKEGKGKFRNTDKEKLVVILFEGSMETLLKRAVWTGRHRNEFWNFLTPVSIITGSFALFTAAYAVAAGPYPDFFRIFSLSLSFLPVVPLFPPGVVFFFLYRRLWREGRYIRAERDILNLPLRFFSQTDIKLDSKTVKITDEALYSFRKIHGKDAAKEICRNENIRIRESSADKCTGDSYFYFYRKGTGSRDLPNGDPMLENIILCNNPNISREKCNREARKKEISSIFVFCAGLAVNFAFTFYFIGLLI